MKFTQVLCLAVVSALAIFVNTASATTLEVKGVKNTGAVTIHEVTSSSSIIWDDTTGSFINTCKTSTVHIVTQTPFTGTRVGGPISAMTFESCTEDAKEKIVVDAAGSLEIENISGTTNGTVFSKNTKVTLPSPFGKLTCTTSSTGTDIGKLTGVASGTATMDISAVLQCGIITAKFSGTRTVDSPEGLGVTA